MDTLQSLASSLIPPTENSTLDIVTILAVVGLLIQIGKLIYECRKDPSDIIEAAKNPGVFDKLWLRAKVNKLSKEINMDKSILCSLIFSKISTLTPEELDKLIMEAQNS